MHHFAQVYFLFSHQTLLNNSGYFSSEPNTRCPFTPRAARPAAATESCPAPRTGRPERRHQSRTGAGARGTRSAPARGTANSFGETSTPRFFVKQRKSKPALSHANGFRNRNTLSLEPSLQSSLGTCKRSTFCSGFQCASCACRGGSAETAPTELTGCSARAYLKF